MNIMIFLLISFGVSPCTTLHNDEFSMSIASLIESFSAKFPNFDLFSCDQKECQETLSHVLQKTLNFNATFRVGRNTKKISKKSRKVRFALVSSSEYYQILPFMENLSSDNFEFDGCFVFVFRELKVSPQQIEIIFKALWSKNIYNVIVQVGLKMFSFVPFRDGACHDTSPKHINEFVNGSWKLNDFFPNNFRDLHNCTIKGSAENMPAVINKTIFPNGSYVLDGFEIHLIRSIAKSLNFHIDIISSTARAGGNIPSIITGDFDLVIGKYYLTLDRLNSISPLQIYRVDSTIAVSALDPLY